MIETFLLTSLYYVKQNLKTLIHKITKQSVDTSRKSIIFYKIKQKTNKIKPAVSLNSAISKDEQMVFNLKYIPSAL